MTKIVISQPMYFPWPGFFEQMMLADHYIWLDDAQFSKGSFTNRVQAFNGADRQWMTIPLKQSTNTIIHDLEAANQKWQVSNRDKLRQSIGKAPHAKHALSLFDAAMAHSGICDVLIESCEILARDLSLPVKKFYRSSQMGVEGHGSNRVLDLVKSVDGSQYITGHGAAEYLNHEAFEQAGISVQYMRYDVAPWPQAGKEFTPYVTTLDLIAQMGAYAKEHLRPKTTNWRDHLSKRR